MTSPRTVARTTADQTVDVTFTVNGTEVATSLPARVTLSDALRDHLQTDLDQNDRLFVAALNDEWATFNMAPSRRWLEEAGPLSAP